MTLGNFSSRAWRRVAAILAIGTAIGAAACSDHDHSAHRPPIMGGTGGAGGAGGGDGGAGGGDGGMGGAGGDGGMGGAGGSSCNGPVEHPIYEVTAVATQELYAINAWGQAAGRSYWAGSPDATNWAKVYLPAPAHGMDAGAHDIDLGPDLLSRAHGINDQGVVVGSLRPLGSPQSTAFAWSPADGKRELAPLAGHTMSVARAINNLGHVVGESVALDGAQVIERAVMWRGDELVDLGGIQGYPSIRAEAVSDPSGAPDAFAIAGTATSADASSSHAFLWLGAPRSGLAAGMNDISASAAGSSTQAFGINDALDVVGARDGKAALHRIHVAECLPAGWHDLHGSLANASGIQFDRAKSVAFGINEAGVAVGQVSWTLPGLPGLLREAVVWIGGEARLVRELVTNGSGLQFWYATAINDAGQIVGFGRYDDDPARVAFVLTPKP